MIKILFYIISLIIFSSCTDKYPWKVSFKPQSTLTPSIITECNTSVVYINAIVGTFCHKDSLSTFAFKDESLTKKPFAYRYVSGVNKLVTPYIELLPYQSNKWIEHPPFSLSNHFHLFPADSDSAYVKVLDEYKIKIPKPKLIEAFKADSSYKNFLATYRVEQTNTQNRN